MQNPRRRFLTWLGGSSLLGVAGIPLGRRPAVPAHGSDHPAPITDTFDMKWVEKVNGKHRAVFDSPEVSDGSALFRAVAWCDMYKDVYGIERADMSPVLVLRHAAIPLVMTNAYWEQYEAGKALKMKDEKGKKWAKANPISLGNTPATDRRAKYTLEQFQSTGGVVLACNWAFGMIVGRIQERDKLENAAARARALELLIPGVVLQPNGIFAALRAQEAGCHYVLAS